MVGLGLPAHHPFGIASTTASRESQPRVETNVVTFDVETAAVEADAVSAAVNAAFVAHNARLAREAPRTDRGHWLLDAVPQSRIFPAFESSVIAAEFYRGVITVAVAKRHWLGCKTLLEDHLHRAGLYDCRAGP